MTMSMKSLLGSSSIRLSLAVGVAFLIVAATIVIVVYTSERRQALENAEERALIILNRNLATHTYFNRDMKPNLFEWSAPFRRSEYFEPLWMSSTFAVREVDSIFRSMGMEDYYYKECAVNARSPLNEADEFETRFIRALNADPRLEKESGVRTIDGKPFFFVLRRGEVMEETCLRCHSVPSKAPGGMISRYGPDRSFHRSVGDVVSAISIRIPLKKEYARADALALKLSGLMLGMLVLLFLLQFWFSRSMLFAPLEQMRDKAIRITERPESLGEQIPVPSGRELSELATAFNRMSTALRSTIESLEDRVQQRTAELEQANRQLSNDIEERKKNQEERERMIAELKEALVKVKMLSGMLPICASCKKIRDDKGYWNRIESYITEHSDVLFSHGLCPECEQKAYEEFDEFRRTQK